MLRSVFLAALMSSIALVASAADVPAGSGRKLATDIRYGPPCTNSYFKSAPGWEPTPGKEYKPCCDQNQGFICATYQGDNQWSTYATCMTPDACKANNGGADYKLPGWDCRPRNNNPFPYCQEYYGRP